MYRQDLSRLAANAFCRKLKEGLSRGGIWAINCLQVCRLQSPSMMADAVQNIVCSSVLNVVPENQQDSTKSNSVV